MLKKVLLMIGTGLIFLAGAASAPLLRAQDTARLPQTPRAGDKLVVYGQDGTGTECNVTAVRGDWVKCGGWRNLVTGAAYTFQSEK
ncbi:MAG TPA: hypothetical protein VJ813_03620 [Vicinamibacterales bacterium]|nr:hypothetical protein [Vicinamibacterales bacterium]